MKNIVRFVTYIALFLLSTVAAHAQFSPDGDPFYCSTDCEVCIRGQEILNRMYMAPEDNDAKEKAFAYISECDMKHLVKFAQMLTARVREEQRQAVSSGEASDNDLTGYMMVVIINKMVSSHEIFEEIALGRDNHLLDNWMAFYDLSNSYFIAPYILEETCSLIQEYEFNKKFNIRHNGYFYNGLLTFLEYLTYGDTRCMCQKIPNYDKTLDNLLKAFKGYEDKLYLIYSREQLQSSAFIATTLFFNLATPNSIHNVYLYDKKLASIYMDVAEEYLRLAYYSSFMAYYYEIVNNFRSLFDMAGKVAQFNAIIEKLNTEIFGDYGTTINTLVSATSVNVGKIKSDHIAYTESLIADGYEFAYYAPGFCPEPVKEEDMDVYMEYSLRTCKMLSDVFGASRNPSQANIQTIQRDLRSIQQFLDIDMNPLIYTVELALTAYSVDPLTAITTLENTLPYAEAMGLFGSLYQLPNIASIYCELGNYQVASTIVTYYIIPAMDLYLSPTYDISPYDIIFATEGIYAMSQLNDDYSEAIVEYADRFTPLFENITLSNYGEQYIEERIYLHLRLADAMNAAALYDKAKEQVDIALNTLATSNIPAQNSEIMAAIADNVMLNICYMTGDYENFMEHYNRLLPHVNSEMFTPTIDTYSKLSYVASQLGDFAYMDDAAHKYMETIRHNISHTMFNLRGEAREQYWQNWSYSGQLLIDAYNTTVAAAEESTLPGVIYDWNLVCKGLLLMANNLFDYRLSTHQDEEVRELYNTYKATSMALEQSYAKVTNQGEIFVLQNQVRMLEESLLSVLRREFKGESLDKGLMVTWQDVREKLGKDEVAIEFMRFEGYEEGEEMESTAKYVALILRKDWELPRIVELCSEAELSKYVSFAKADNLRLYNTIRSKELYAITWSKIAEYINQGDVVYYATDGLLHQINLDALRVSGVSEKIYADDIYDLHRLSSTRELCVERRDVEYQQAALFGNLNYHMGDNEVEIVDRGNDNETYLISRTLGAGAGNLIPRTEIPESEALMHTVSGILQEADIESDIYLWNNGTENAFKQLSGTATDLILLYTHGFYLEGITEYQSSDTELSPMMRSGLLMAGSADISLNSDNDGLLLAREIADMDLSCVDLVFLSACQTAQGKITSDGVFGIQRGLKQAGVNTIIMTLWEVNAVMSLALVEEFYKALTLPNTTKLEAFRIARDKIRAAYPTFDWAAYIMLD